MKGDSEMCGTSSPSTQEPGAPSKRSLIALGWETNEPRGLLLLGPVPHPGAVSSRLSGNATNPNARYSSAFHTKAGCPIQAQSHRAWVGKQRTQRFATRPPSTHMLPAAPIQYAPAPDTQTAAPFPWSQPACYRTPESPERSPPPPPPPATYC